MERGGEGEKEGEKRVIAASFHFGRGMYVREGFEEERKEKKRIKDYSKNCLSIQTSSLPL